MSSDIDTFSSVHLFQNLIITVDMDGIIFHIHYLEGPSLQFSITTTYLHSQKQSKITVYNVQ
jgi:hypothetical protein